MEARRRGPLVRPRPHRPVVPPLDVGERGLPRSRVRPTVEGGPQGHGGPDRRSFSERPAAAQPKESAREEDILESTRETDRRRRESEREGIRGVETTVEHM